MSQRVLVVEDDDDLREVICLFLKELGYDVREAASGLDGVAIAAEWRPRFVLLDLGLPGLDGYGVARDLRELEAPPMRIIAMSGSDPSDRGLDFVFDHHILKPFGADDLRRKLQEVLAGT
jgi:two-component system, sensor histidine kinase